MKNVNVICTRKLDKALVEYAATNGISINDIDFLDITYIENELFTKELVNADTPLFITSVHAIQSILKFYPTLVSAKKIKCFCIEGKTSALAIANGFEVIDSAPSALQLADVVWRSNIKSIIYPCGNIKNDELHKFYSEQKIECKEYVVYKKQFLSISIPKYDAVMFFSPSQIDAFLLSNNLKEDVPVFCIGKTTAKRLKNHKSINICEISTQENMVQLAINYYKKEKSI